jgi:D-lactate dehydrogenase
MEATGDRKTRKAIAREFYFDGLETCAVDGMCSTVCPVGINTGDLVKRLRGERHSSFRNKLSLRAARNFHLFEGAARFAVKTAFFLNRIFGRDFMKNLTRTGRKIAALPIWSDFMSPPPAAFKKTRADEDASVSTRETPRIVYFPSCVSRMMGGVDPDLFLSVSKKAGIAVKIPPDIKGTCCGQIFSSKGYAEAYRSAANRAVEKLWRASDEGEIPVVSDTTSCTQTLTSSRDYLTEENRARFDKIRILDIIDFAAETALPRLKISGRKKKIVFHPVCSAHKMGMLPKLRSVGETCAAEAFIPVFAGCCGMAGDRGLFYPQLTAAALGAEVSEVAGEAPYDGYYSTSTTCQIALSEAVGERYESILKLLDEVSE